MGRSYKVVCHEFAKRTTISGIYFIDKYKSKWIKLIWFGIFWILVALTVWQSVVCLRNFSANPTVIYIKIKRDHDIQFPAITFCTTNPFMRHKVENTESPIKDVMKKFEQALRNDEISSQTRRKRQDENDECPPMWMHTEIGCIYFSNASAMPYAYAKDYCEKLGGHLPIFLTLNDFEKFQNWWKVLNMSTSLFLGLHYNGAIGSWQWINGCKFQPYPNFWASYPSLWWRASVKYDQRGAESRGYLQFIPICQIMLNRTQTTTCPPFPATSTEMRPIFYECTKNWWCPTNSSQLVDNSYANTYCFCMLFTSEPANSNEKCKSIGSILSKGESRLKHLKFLMDQTKKDNEVNSTLCPPDFVYFNKSCFYYEYWWPTYRIFAKMVCESKYNSRLASIHSMDELWLLYNMMDRKGYNTPAVWIGGYRENVYSDNWQWHDDTPYDYQGPWSTWPYGPQPNHEYYLCFTPQDGNLHDAVAMIFNYVCRAEFSALTDETAEPENVPDNYTVCYKTKRNCDSSWVRFDDDCFYFTETNQNFEDARQACKALNADLPVFKDITVYKRFLHFWISNNYSESFWVGLIYIRSWQWINTCAYLNYPNFWNVSAIFNHSTFNFNYAVMYKNGLMEPITKTNKANVICHMTDNTDCGVLPAANSKLDPHYFLCTDKKWWCPDTRPSIPVSVPVGKCYCNVFGTDTCASVKTFTASQDTFGDMLTRLVADNAVYMRLCPPEFTYFNQTCLFVSKEKMNLTTAKAYCSNHYGSNLSTVHSVEEQWFLYKSLLLISNDETDLLINGVKKSGVFTWLDNSPFDYNPTWSSTGAGTLLNKPFKDSLYLTIK